MVAHARDVIERALTNKALGEIRAKAHADAWLIPLPDDIEELVAGELAADTKQPWDLVVAEIATDAMSEAVGAAEWDEWASSLAADLDAACWGAS